MIGARKPSPPPSAQCEIGQRHLPPSYRPLSSGTRLSRDTNGFAGDSKHNFLGGKELCLKGSLPSSGRSQASGWHSKTTAKPGDRRRRKNSHFSSSTLTLQSANFSLRFAPVSESKVEAADSLFSRQVLQRIATRISLVSEAIGFSILGILI